MKWLLETGLPFLDCTMQVRTIFCAPSTFPSFDAVGYSADGPNLLITRHGFGDNGGQWGRIMRAWEKIFGDGFVAVRAVCTPQGNIRFLDREGMEHRLVAA